MPKLSKEAVAQAHVNKASSDGKRQTPKGGYKAWYNPLLPKGYDLSDHYDRDEDLAVLFQQIMDAMVLVPKDWLVKTYESSSGSMECVPCVSYEEMIKAWREALRWTTGLDCTLAAMLATVLSTKIIGDQLWLKVIGPASCGKSTLAEALSICDEYIIAKSTIRGFHTGWKSADGQDHSLIAEMRGKTLIQKDGDTLLKMPNREQTLAEARDLYDGSTRSHYKNDEGSDYSGIRTTWILCGTNSLTSLDSSELGERMLTCVVMEGIDDEMEDEVLSRVGWRTMRNMAVESDGKAETHQEPKLTTAMQLTGGYVRHLRQNATKLLVKITADDEAINRCIRLGKFVAFMRARPSKTQEEQSEREFAARLVSQLVRLATCLSVVLNKPTIDEDVMWRVDRMALDTCRGDTVKICHAIYKSEKGLIRNAVHSKIGGDKAGVTRLLNFLVKIGVARASKKNKPQLYTLTPKFSKLYEEVMWP